jgi:hypothetical protein
MRPDQSRSSVLGSLTDLALRILTARRAFLLVAMGILAFNFLGSFALRNTLGKDFWEHIGAMRAFSDGLWGPPNPYLASSSPTHLFTPYHWLWGAVSAALQVHPLILVPLIGTLNIALFLVAVDAVAGRILGDRRWSLLVTLSFLLLWWNPWDWSGFYDIGLLPLTSSYPYWFALSISLLLIAHYPFTDYRWRLAAIPVVGLVFLVHPITALFLVLSLALKVSLSGEGSIGRKVGLAALPLTGFGLALLWPYFPVLEAIGAQGRFQQTGFSGDYRIFYEGAFIKLLPALPGAFYLARAAWLRRPDFVSAGMVLFFGIYLLNLWVLRSGPIARLVVFVALFLQLGVVMLMKMADGRERWRRPAFGLLLVVLLIAGVGEVWDARRWVRLEPWTHGTTALDDYSRYRPYGEFLDGDDVVLSDPATSWVLAPIVGTKVVAVLHANPFFHDHYRRLRDVEGFLRSDRDQMLRIVERYGVTHILVPRVVVGGLSPIRQDLHLVFEDGANLLFRYEG